jgi:hypothetical protein
LPFIGLRPSTIAVATPRQSSQTAPSLSKYSTTPENSRLFVSFPLPVPNP